MKPGTACDPVLRSCAPAIRAVGADDRVAADGDVGRRQGAGEIVEAHVRDDEIGLGGAAALHDTVCDRRGVELLRHVPSSDVSRPVETDAVELGGGRPEASAIGRSRPVLRNAEGVVHTFLPGAAGCRRSPEEGMASHSAVFEAIKASGPTRWIRWRASPF